MLKRLSISGFRSFRELHIEGLTRVNLFVGTNNAGKTSILEAIELIVTGTLSALLRSPLRRGEQILTSRDDSPSPLRAEPELDLSHLFYGHALHAGSTFSIEGVDNIRHWIRCGVIPAGPDKEDEDDVLQRSLLDIEVEGPRVALTFQSHALPEQRTLRLSSYGGIQNPLRRNIIYSSPEITPPVSFLGTEATEAFLLSQLWDAVVLTPEEDSVAASLRIIEPAIERIAFLGENRRASRSVFLKLSNSDQRLPLGSVGDGLKRLLALTLHLLSAKKGFLLVDEIDTGLHHTVMADMWRLVIETAKRLDVQAFATTHSLDCVRALARVREKYPELAEEVTLHRIDRTSSRTVTYSADELVVAAQSYIEVR